jgi:hypothetical protein
MIRYDAPRKLDDFDDWVVRAILSPGSPMFLEARYLLAEEPDLRDGALYHSVLSAIAEGNSGRGGIAGYVGRKSNELSHPLTVLEDAGLIARETDAFRGNRTDFRIREPLLTFYHAIMRPFWPQLMRATATDRIWQRARQRFAGNVLGPHFERLCRDWVLHFAEDRFGGWPSQVTAGTVNDPANRTTHQVDVAAVGHSDDGKAPLLAIGEVKWGETMGIEHLERLRRIRDLINQNGKYDSSRTRLVCYSGAGFTRELLQVAGRGEAELVGLDDLYG